MIRGLDASAVQREVPFHLLGSEYKFAILKAQQGNDGFDPFFVRNADAAFDHGLEVFAYCFTYPLPHLDPKAQAALFVQRLEKTRVAGRPIFLDNEWPEVGPGWKKWGCSPKQLADWQQANAEEVHRLSGVRPVIYTYDYWWGAVRDGAPSLGYPHGADVSWASEYDLWMAWYRTGWPKPGDAPKVPRPFRTWRFWQFDGNKGLKLPNGVDCDFCVFNGDEAALKSYALGGKPEDDLCPPVGDLNTVRGIQTRLTAIGFFPGPIDGVMGPKTMYAIKQFQLVKGLKVDGIVGPLTRAALANP